MQITKFKFRTGVFFPIFSRTSVLPVGPLIPLFWTSNGICPGFQCQSASLACMLHGVFCFFKMIALKFPLWKGVFSATDCFVTYIIHKVLVFI